MNKQEMPEVPDELLEEVKREMRRVKIIRNSIKCLKCGDEIRSTSCHDIRSCKCGSVCVDGGTDYLRRCGNPEDYEDTSVCQEVEDEQPQQSTSSGKA